MTRPLLLICAFSLVTAQVADNSIGKWKGDIASSKTSTNTTVSEIIVNEAAPGGIKSTGTMRKSDGTAVIWAFTAKYDGKDNPVSQKGEGSHEARLYNTVSVKQIDPNTFERVQAGDKLTTTSRVEISADGKTMTVYDHRDRTDGKKEDLRYVYQRQN